MDSRDDEKKERLLGALDQGMVMVHLDARRPGVLVPRHLADEAHLRLNISYRFDPPDVTVGEWGVRCTLSFNRSRCKVAIPWSALFAITSHATKEFWLYPDDMPQELIQQAVQHAQTKGPGEKDDGEAESVVALKPAPGSGLGSGSASAPRAVLREITGDKPHSPDDGTGDDEPPPPRARGHLRVIK